jgi:hypothetical protein
MHQTITKIVVLFHQVHLVMSFIKHTGKVII